MSNNNVVFYYAPPEKYGKLWWKTTAHIESNGDIQIISGGGGREWYTTIAAQEVAALQEALMRHLPSAASADVMALLAQKFTAEDNPYSDILAFLKSENIQYSETVW